MSFGMYCRTAIGAVTAPADPIAPVAAGKTKLVIDSHGRCGSFRFDPATGGTAITGTAVTGGTVLVVVLISLFVYHEMFIQRGCSNTSTCCGVWCSTVIIHWLIYIYIYIYTSIYFCICNHVSCVLSFKVYAGLLLSKSFDFLP